jgi:uncharacterized protein (TIGR02996 family)
MSTPDDLSAPLASFIDDVKAHPEEDAPRLILADWLQDQPDPKLAARGELLHLQVVRARLAEDDPQREILRQREGEILRDHVLEWLGPLGDLASSWRFERGFIRIEARGDKLYPPEGLPDLPPGLLAWVDGLKVGELTRVYWSSLFRYPLLSHVIFLDLSGQTIGGSTFIRLLPLGRLVELRLAGCELADDQTLVLARSKELSCLRTLDLSNNRLTDQSARTLSQSPLLPRLTTLLIGGNGLTAEGIGLLRQRFGSRVLVELPAEDRRLD